MRRSEGIQLGSAAEACAAAADGSWLAVAKSGSVTIHDPASGKVREEIKCPDLVYRAASLGSEFLLLELAREVLVCEARDWQATRTLRHPDGSTIYDLSAGGDLVCVKDDEDRRVLWDLRTWQSPKFLEADESGLHVRDKPVGKSNFIMKRLRRWRRRLGGVIGVAIALEAGWLAVNVGKVVHVVSPTTWKRITSLSFDEPVPVDGIVAVPNGRWLVVVIDGTVQYWNAYSWAVETEFIYRDGASEVARAWSPDCSLLATVSYDRTLRIRDGIDWSCLTELRLDDELKGYAWLTEDRLAVVGSHGIYWFTYFSADRSPTSTENIA